MQRRSDIGFRGGSCAEVDGGQTRVRCSDEPGQGLVLDKCNCSGNESPMTNGGLRKSGSVEPLSGD